MIITITSRMDSSRLPGKALYPLHGRPMLHRLYDRMKQTGYPVLICTGDKPENKKLVDYCKTYQIPTLEGPENDVMQRLIIAGEVTGHEDIIRVTGDNPLTSIEIIGLLAGIHLTHKNDYTYIEGPPTGVRCEVIRVQALKELWKKTDDPELRENMTPALKTMPKTRKVPCPVQWLNVGQGFTVDTQEQMTRMQKIWDYFKGNPPIDLDELILWAHGSEIGRMPS